MIILGMSTVPSALFIGGTIFARGKAAQAVFFLLGRASLMALPQAIGSAIIKTFQEEDRSEDYLSLSFSKRLKKAMTSILFDQANYGVAVLVASLGIKALDPRSLPIKFALFSGLCGLPLTVLFSVLRYTSISHSVRKPEIPLKSA